MANYYAKARSNYFRVKDVINFRDWAEARNLRIVQNDDTFAIFSEEDNGWPSLTLAGDDCDVIEELAPFLAANEVAVLMQAGAEGARYVDGFAWALHSNGESERITLDDIYEVVHARWGIEPSKALY